MSGREPVYGGIRGSEGTVERGCLLQHRIPKKHFTSLSDSGFEKGWI